MSWITVDTGLPNHAKLAALPNDAARWGWLVTLCEAKEQKEPGIFADARHFRHVLGRLGKYLQDYTAAGLLDEVEGRLEVHGWGEYQRDRTANERQRRHRDRGVTVTDENRDITVTHAGGSAVALAVAVDVPEESPERNPPDAVDAFYRRTGDVPGAKIRGWLNELATAHTEARLVAMIADTPNDGLNVPDYLRSVQDRLRLQDHALEREKRTTPRPPRKTEAERDAEYKATTQEMARLMGRPS